MAHHSIKPERATLHGCFSRDIPPILTIQPGDSVRYETLDANWFVEPKASTSNPPVVKDDLGIRFSPREMPYDEGHALCGPIYIDGAKPGMMLAIHIERVIPGTWGWVYPFFGTPYEQKDEVPVIFWDLDSERMTGRNQWGHTVALNPFMGVMGMPPDEPGLLSTDPPRITGGNIDCKALIAGSTLYLPIGVEGGLFSLGDGHGTQGDGESGGTAIECGMAEVDVSFDLVEKPIINTPYADTPSGWLTFGFDESLQAAHDMALNAMQDFISARYSVDRLTALGLMGVTVDMHVTQTVNGVKGVHATLPHGAIR